jgi:hypothetical protein
MNEIKKQGKHAGGRPKKLVRKDQQLAVMCNMVERKYIEAQARQAYLSVSEFLRTLGLKGQVGRKIKVLPKEVLQFTATLNHLAANLNQVAKKRNMNDELNALERASLEHLSREIKQLATGIKIFLS